MQIPTKEDASYFALIVFSQSVGAFAIFDVDGILQDNAPMRCMPLALGRHFVLTFREKAHVPVEIQCVHSSI